MDESRAAISKTNDEAAAAADLVGSNSSPEVNEVVRKVRAAGSVTAPLTFIGGSGGSQSQIRGWNEGKVITRIRVYSGEYTIKAYTIWLSDSAGITYGTPGNTSYADYTFQDGERITALTLWGNGVGTRAGWIEFKTTRGNTFSYGMYGRKRQTAYPVEVASGVLVGAIFNAGSDIDAHGFWFLNPIDSSELTNVKYPTLDFDTAGIIPKLLDRFQYTNNSTTPKDWDFSRVMKETTQITWSITTSLTVHATLRVKAGVPLVAEVEGEFGWEIGVTGHYEQTQTSEQELRWSVQGTCKPGDRVDLKAITRQGTLNVPYEGTMVVNLKNGSSFAYVMKGTYTGISYSGVEVIDDSTR